MEFNWGAFNVSFILLHFATSYGLLLNVFQCQASVYFAMFWVLFFIKRETLMVHMFY